MGVVGAWGAAVWDTARAVGPLRTGSAVHGGYTTAPIIGLPKSILEYSVGAV